MDLRKKVQDVFSDVAEHPDGSHPYDTGRSLAEELGYPDSFLDDVPRNAVERFAGVSAVPVWSKLQEGGTVLEIGSGAGLDSLLAAKRVGSDGTVTGVDFSESMVQEARAAADQMNVSNLEFLQAPAEDLPFEDATFDAVMANGIFNLNPNREKIFEEIARVLKEGGSFWGAELILTEPLSEEERNDPENWFR